MQTLTGHVLGRDFIDMADVNELLKFLAFVNSSIKVCDCEVEINCEGLRVCTNTLTCQGRLKASLIVQLSIDLGRPRMADVLEILKFFAGVPGNLISIRQGGS